MDYYKGGSLGSLLWKHKTRSGLGVGLFTETEVRFFAAELYLAIQHLHEKDIVHNDLKPDNILMDHEGHVYIADFGSSLENITSNRVQWNGGGCTYLYVAPEMISSNQYGKPLDWWCLGVIVYELFACITPWEYLKKTIYDPLQQSMTELKRKTQLDEVENTQLIKLRDQRNTLIYTSIKNDIEQFPPDLFQAASQDATNFIQSLLNKDPSMRDKTVQKLRKCPFFDGIDSDALEEKRIKPPYKPKNKPKKLDSPKSKPDDSGKQAAQTTQSLPAKYNFTSNVQFEVDWLQGQGSDISNEKRTCTVYDDAVIQLGSLKIDIKEIQLRTMTQSKSSSKILFQILDTSDRFYILQVCDDLKPDLEKFLKHYTTWTGTNLNSLGMVDICFGTSSETKQCWCVLGRGLIIYYDSEQSLIPKGVIHFDKDVQLLEPSSEILSGNYVRVVTPDKDQWTEAIKKQQSVPFTP